MSQPAIQDLPVGTRVQDTLIVLDVEARGGDTPHTIVTFGNATGRLPSAPVWATESHRIAGLVRGNVVRVVGTITSYRDRRQLTITAIHPVSRDEVDWQALLPSVGDIGPYWRAVDRCRQQIRGPRLARTLDLFFDDPHFRARYEKCPAGTAGHHAQLGGLLKHTWEVTHIALEIGRVCPNADADLLLAGALLHDVGKLETYRWDVPFETTLRGVALGHVVLGLLYLDQVVRAVSPMPCTEAELLLLEHIILSHHGRLEYGAPVLPMTLEAEIVHYADETSARTASLDLALRDPENFPGGREVSIRTIWQLDHRRAWRGQSDWGRDRAGH